MNNVLNINFSFDDGHISDIKVARLLEKYGFTGTFYLSNAPVAKTIQMSIKEVKEHIVDKGHMIGGHTVSHPMDMKVLPDDKLMFEIINNKALIFQVFKKLPTKFCYPRGRHDERVRKAVKDCGYNEARTTQVLKIKNESGDAFQTPTTIHLFQRTEYEGLDWLIVAKEWFHKALKAYETDENVFYSVWGHSVELDRYNEWQKFEDLLCYIKEQLVIHNGANVAISL